MKKQKIKLLSTLAVILILIIFGAIYFTKQNKYNNRHVRDLDSYKKIDTDLEDGIGYYGTLNNYFDYDQDTLYSMYLFFDVNEDIYRLLGDIKIKAKTTKASESEKRFDIAYVPTFPATRIMFQFHGDNIIIDGDEYKTEGLDELRKYIAEHTLTTEDIIAYAGEDKEAINEVIKKAWSLETATSTEAVKESLPSEISDTVTAKLDFSYYLYQTTGSGMVINYYPVADGFLLEYKTSGTFTLYSLNGNAEPLVIENNPDEVRKYIEENK